MRLQVTLLRDKVAEKRAKEKAEAPTVKTEDQMKADEAAKAKEKAAQKEAPKSIWKRKFRPLQESKAVDLFADVIGDSFILLVAVGLILYEYIRTSKKPDHNAEKIAEIKAETGEKLAESEKREHELEEAVKSQQGRIETLEQAIEEMRKASIKQKNKRILSLS
jgi:optic atrophy 3 protein